MPVRKVVVGKSADLTEGKRLSVEVGGRHVVVFNVRGKYYALLNRCPHRGAELCTKGRFQPLITSDGPGDFVLHGENPLLACPWHGWQFDVTTGQSYFDPVGTRVRPYEVTVESGGQVQAEVESGEASFTPAEYAAFAGSSEAIADGLQPGPYKVETFDVSVEDEYVVVSTRPARPVRTARVQKSETEGAGQ